MKTTLQQIKQAFAWNYGAVLKIEDLFFDNKKTFTEALVVSVSGRLFLRTNDGIVSRDWFCIEDTEILGYKYLGELGGGEEIPEGQRFRVKKIAWNKELSGEIVEFTGYRSDRLIMKTETGAEFRLALSEIEPYFES